MNCRDAAVLLILSLLGLACASTRPEVQAAGAAPPLSHKMYTLGASSEPESLLVVLHYSGSTPEFWDEHVQALGTAVRVLAPRGFRPHREGFTWFPADHEQKGWPERTEDVERVAGQLADLIREVRRAHPEIRRVAVTGFSYGGDLAWMLAIRHPELVDVAVPMGSRLLGDPAQSLPKTGQVLVLQGEVDPIIKAQQTHTRVEALKAMGVPIEVKTYPGLDHDMSPQLLEDWRAFLRQALQGPGER